jgi:hypothetical protein
MLTYFTCITSVATCNMMMTCSLYQFYSLFIFIVFDEERRRVDAWAKVFATEGFEAAQEAERQEIALIRKEKDDNDLANFKAFEKMMLDGKVVKEAREKAKKEANQIEDENQENVSSANNNNGNSASTTTTTTNPFSGESIMPVKETAALTTQREQRLADALSGKTSKMVEEAIKKKSSESLDAASTSVSSSASASISSQQQQEEEEEAYDNKAEWTKCNIVEELDDDDDDEVASSSGSKQAPVSIDLNDIDIDQTDEGGAIDTTTTAKVDEDQEQSSSLALLAALDGKVNVDTLLTPPPPLSTAVAVVGNSTDLFELD